MNISVEMIKSFNKAVVNPENVNDDGSVNWNYVDADVYMDMHQFGETDTNKGHYEKFNALADAFVANKRVS